MGGQRGDNGCADWVLVGLIKRIAEARMQRVDIKDRESEDMRARALECNLFVVLPDRDIMLVGADDQDPGPAAPPFTDFLRVVRDDGPADYTYLWMIDLLPDDPRVFLEIVGLKTGRGDLPVQLPRATVHALSRADRTRQSVVSVDTQFNRV